MNHNFRKGGFCGRSPSELHNLWLNPPLQKLARMNSSCYNLLSHKGKLIQLDETLRDNEAIFNPVGGSVAALACRTLRVVDRGLNYETSNY